MLTKKECPLPLLFLFRVTIFLLPAQTMNVDELINKLQDTLNKLTNNNDLGDKTTELSNELLETLKVLENCKDKKIDGIDLDKFHKSINKIENCLIEGVKKKWYTIHDLNQELFKINIGLN